MSGGKRGGAGPSPAGPRWLEDNPAPGAQALRQALDDAGRAESQLQRDHEQTFARQRVWGRVQAPWFGPGGQTSGGRGWWPSLLLGGGVASIAAVAMAVVIHRSGAWPLGDGDRRASPAVTSTGETNVPARGQTGSGARGGPELTALPSQPAGGAFTTGPGERIRHRLARGVDAELAARTALVPGDLEAPPEVRVGRVRFSVPEQPPGRRYIVRAGAYEVVVLGTVFDVAVEEPGVRVDVQSGTVEVRDASTHQRLARVTARRRWRSEDNQITELPAPTRATARRRPARKVPPALSHTAEARSLDQASDLRRRGDSARALAVYQRLASGNGPLAEIAHYEMGVLEDEDLRDSRRAVATWERYRARYPKGLLRAEAELSIIEALTRLGEERRALDEAVAFLQRQPESERRAEVARVAGDLARQGGDCRAALPLYDQALAARPSREDADDATFHRAACFITLGDRRGLPTVRAYLAAFPLGRHAFEAQRLLGGGAAPAKR